MNAQTNSLHWVLSRLEAKRDKYLREREIYAMYCDYVNARKIGSKACIVRDCIYEVKLALGLVHPHKR